MNLGDAESQLPNGLHDADLLRFEVDYEKRTAEFEFNAWIGDLDSTDHAEREKHQHVKLLIRGLHFLIFEKPDPNYIFGTAAPGVPEVGGFSAWNGEFAPPDEIGRLVERMPVSAFYEAAFVSNWNSFIHIGADDAEIKVIDQ